MGPKSSSRFRGRLCWNCRLGGRVDQRVFGIGFEAVAPNFNWELDLRTRCGRVPGALRSFANACPAPWGEGRTFELKENGYVEFGGNASAVPRKTQYGIRLRARSGPRPRSCR